MNERPILLQALCLTSFLSSFHFSPAHGISRSYFSLSLSLEFLLPAHFLHCPPLVHIHFVFEWSETEELVEPTVMAWYMQSIVCLPVRISFPHFPVSASALLPNGLQQLDRPIFLSDYRPFSDGLPLPCRWHRYRRLPPSAQFASPWLAPRVIAVSAASSCVWSYLLWALAAG